MKNLKERLKNGETVLGTWSSIPAPSLIETIGCSGLDFVVIDGEHGPVNMETASDLIRAAEVAQMTPIIRVPSNEASLILKALDIGAHGVQVPHVSTRQEAEGAVQSSKYFPKGHRGFSPFTRAGRYGLNAKDHAQRSNQNTMVILNIEGKEGLNNLKSIASVPDIDVLFIGPYDLSQSLGKPGAVEDPEIIQGIRHGVGIAKDQGLVCGSFARDERYLEILIECGVQYITYMVDSAVLLQAYKDLSHIFKEKKQGVAHGKV